MNQIIDDYLDDYWSDDEHDNDDVEIIEISEQTLEALACLEREFSFKPDTSPDEMYDFLIETKDVDIDTANEAISLFQEKEF